MNSYTEGVHPLRRIQLVRKSRLTRSGSVGDIIDATRCVLILRKQLPLMPPLAAMAAPLKLASIPVISSVVPDQYRSGSNWNRFPIQRHNLGRPSPNYGACPTCNNNVQEFSWAI